jgi:hypothetical protein
MVEQVWSDEIDFSYCTLENATWDDDAQTVLLDSDSLTGSLTTDIRDSGDLINEYGQINVGKILPTFSDITYYYKMSDDIDDMGDWVEIDTGSARIENCISLFDDRIMTDYDIAAISSILLEADYREGYIETESSYVDVAIVGQAQVGFTSDKVEYVTYASRSGNQIDLSVPLPEDSTNLIVTYLPVYPIVGGSGRYIQLKFDFETTLLGEQPGIYNIDLGYRLSTAPAVSRQWPMFYRRL